MNRFQEPYLIARYSKSTIFYDERFINYGCNKVQLVDHLRHFGMGAFLGMSIIGYKFYILTNSFAMDIVHHE